MENVPLSGILQIFVKNKIAGKVKTRLAATIGDENALKVYSKLLFRLKSNLKEISIPVRVYYSDYIESDDVWPGQEVRPFVQYGRDLGERMKNAFRSGCEQHDFVILIGSDCPLLNVEDIQQCMSLLQKNDVVLGPSEDGGYYLIACKNFFPFLFENITWSTSSVFQETKQKIDAYGLSCATLPVKRDLDEYDDYLYFADMLNT